MLRKKTKDKIKHRLWRSFATHVYGARIDKGMSLEEASTQSGISLEELQAYENVWAYQDLPLSKLVEVLGFYNKRIKFKIYQCEY